MSPAASERARLGDEMWSFVERAFPICRSITGAGLRETLGMLAERLLGLQIVEIESGTPVLDWVVPGEWNVREAWLRSESGETVVDFAHNNLHLMSYSVPISGTFSLQALREEKHLYTLPD